ncbi:MAG: hypothetical protein QOD06_1281, partial [Candidatus Binatota bacterium]|nr:hypothetical protein [Candidatus Binatota bacterium]
MALRRTGEAHLSAASSDRALPSSPGFGENGAMGKRYLEDFAVGETIDLGSKTVSRDEILRF